jgi:DNA-binding transcriptional regulator/RsmH inhibitor MraZ
VSQPVVLVGTGRVVEIWSPQHLDVSLAEAGTDEEQLFASLVSPAKPSMPVSN